MRTTPPFAYVPTFDRSRRLKLCCGYIPQFSLGYLGKHRWQFVAICKACGNYGGFDKSPAVAARRWNGGRVKVAAPVKVWG